MRGEYLLEWHHDEGGGHSRQVAQVGVMGLDGRPSVP